MFKSRVASHFWPANIRKAGHRVAGVSDQICPAPLGDVDPQRTSELEASLRRQVFDYSRGLIAVTVTTHFSDASLAMDILKGLHGRWTLLETWRVEYLVGRQRQRLLASFQEANELALQCTKEQICESYIYKSKDYASPGKISPFSSSNSISFLPVSAAVKRSATYFTKPKTTPVFQLYYHLCLSHLEQIASQDTWLCANIYNMRSSPLASLILALQRTCSKLLTHTTA